jgi:Holliday junction resolvasome RuvABC ATP-dependent DNA helicase subunit
LVHEGKNTTSKQREFNMLQKGQFTMQMCLNSLGSPRIANETVQRVGEVLSADERGQLEVAVGRI